MDSDVVGYGILFVLVVGIGLSLFYDLAYTRGYDAGLRTVDPERHRLDKMREDLDLRAQQLRRAPLTADELAERQRQYDALVDFFDATTYPPSSEEAFTMHRHIVRVLDGLEPDPRPVGSRPRLVSSR